MQYKNFDLRIRRDSSDYRVHVTSPAGEGHGRFRVPRELEPLVSGRRDAKRRGRRHLTVEAVGVAPGEVGLRLFEALFAGEVGVRFSINLHEARRQRQGLRIRLWLGDVPELVGLPWERLREPGRDRPLALSVRTPVVRYLELPEAVQPIPADPPLRVLVVRANPSDICRLDLDQESLLLAQSLSRLTARRLAVIDHLESATLPALVEQLSHARYHVLHFMGHGELGKEGGTLLFEDEQGRSVPVPFRQLAALLDSPDLRLIVLNACEGARSSGADPFDGVAQSLVRGGIPAVVAMQLPVSDKAALQFTRTFYRLLADGQPVEVAITEARRMIYAGESSTEWATPVLYSRSEDSRMIKPSPAWRWLLAAALAFLIILTGVAVTYRPQHSSAPEPLISQPAPKPPPVAPNPPECPSPPGLDMAFVKIEPGHSVMGEEKGDHEDEPVHAVEISRPFCLGAFEVTQEQWDRIMGGNPSPFRGPALPIHKASWEMVQEFIALLNEREGGNFYRLPTEAEWEYAARAGSRKRYSFGDDDTMLPFYGNCLSRGSNDRFDAPAPVGSFKPNKWGLYDMHGNVWEWVGDWYGPYAPTAARDPIGPVHGKERVRRGGSWASRKENCRTAVRRSSKPGARSQEIGFRLVREVR